MRRRLVLGLVAAAVFVWLAIALSILWSARSAAREGIDALERARGVLTPEGVIDGEGDELLLDAQAHFDRAHDRAGSLWVAPLRVLPVVGRQVRSVDALTSAARDVTTAGLAAVDATRAELQRAPADGPARVATTNRLADIAARTNERLEAVDLGPSRGLFAPLRDARDRFEDELTKFRDATVRVRDGSAALATFLEGPSSYLVVAANNNEMRVGSGAFLSIGQLDVVDGALQLVEMQSTTAVPVAPGAVAISGDFADRWGWLTPETEWRNLASSPRFETQGELAARMWHAATGVEVDGVLVLDPIALRALLIATGPVTVDGVEYSADTVLDELYLDQYVVEDDPDFETAARRDRLAAIAQAALARFDAGGYEAGDLIDALRDAALGRHVLAWARDDDVQRGWDAARISGMLEPNSLLVGLHNRAGNKLDQFVEVDIALEAADGRAELTVELRNTAPDGLPRYVDGPYPTATDGAPGKYQGLLVFELPAGFGNVTATDGDGTTLTPVVAGPDGDHATFAVYVEMPRAEAAVVIVRADVHLELDRIRVEPSARVPEITWRTDSDEWVDDRARTVPL